MLRGFEYFKNERQLNDDSINAFNLGYCDDDGSIYIGSSYTGKPIDFGKHVVQFKNTALFPIFDMYGDLIGVSGRNLNYQNKDDLKYVNTIYNKTEHLYGLNLAWKYAVSENRLYVVEGNVDTVMMYQHGFRNTVGMLGSTLRVPQLCLMARFVDEVYLVPDGDTSGNKLIERLWNPYKLNKSLLNKYQNLDTKFFHVKLPTYYDPDKFLREKGAEEFKKLEVVELNSAKSLFSL
jgi:DNA primase